MIFLFMYQSKLGHVFFLILLPPPSLPRLSLSPRHSLSSPSPSLPHLSLTPPASFLWHAQLRLPVFQICHQGMFLSKFMCFVLILFYPSKIQRINSNRLTVTPKWLRDMPKGRFYLQQYTSIFEQYTSLLVQSDTSIFQLNSYVFNTS